MNKHPFVRLIFISMSALIILIITLFTVRQVGLSRNHKPLTIAFLEGSPIVILNGGLSDQLPTHSPEAIAACYKLGHIPMIEIYRTHEGNFALKNNTMLFSDFIKQFAGKPFILNLAEQDAAKYYGLKEIIEKNRELLNIMAIYSPNKAPINYMRKEIPRAVIALNYHDLFSSIFLTSLYIEPIATFKGDLVISPLTMYDQNLFPARLVKELRRRKFKIILDFTKSKPENIPFNYDGYIATKPL